jgi:hypothetical protein
VTSASVAYTLSPANQEASVQLQPAGGSAWTAAVTKPAPSDTVSSATLTATDAAGHASTASAAC